MVFVCGCVFFVWIALSGFLFNVSMPIFSNQQKQIKTFINRVGGNYLFNAGQMGFLRRIRG